jgi:hypothetical protein
MPILRKALFRWKANSRYNSKKVSDNPRKYDSSKTIKAKKVLFMNITDTPSPTHANELRILAAKNSVIPGN